MTTILLMHGVPDTAAMWRPLIDALDAPDSKIITPTLPGFGVPRPSGFTSTKDAYAEWLMAEAEKAVQEAGEKIHIFGHDWGAILTVYVAMMRPDLFASWGTANGFAGPGRRWHDLAKKWQTPVVGEAVMLLMRKAQLEGLFKSQGMSAELAAEEAAACNWTMRQSILSLYRSAKTLSDDWPRDFDRLPEKGLLVWGTKDPYAPLSMAQKVSDEWNIPLHKEEEAGHWSIVERADSVAARLKEHWGLDG